METENNLHELIDITDAAKTKFISLLDDCDADTLGVRVYVAGGGCNGMQYGMTFAQQKTHYDYEIDQGDFNLLIDPVALNYIEGAQIDYVEDGVNTTFVFNNVFQSIGGSGACGGCGSAA